MMSIKSCPKCGARWLDGKLFWHTGTIASEADLAGLVCDETDDDAPCINELKGTKHGGQTWAERDRTIKLLTQEAMKWTKTFPKLEDLE